MVKNITKIIDESDEDDRVKYVFFSVLSMIVSIGLFIIFLRSMMTLPSFIELFSLGMFNIAVIFLSMIPMAYYKGKINAKIKTVRS